MEKANKLRNYFNEANKQMWDPTIDEVGLQIEVQIPSHHPTIYMFHNLHEKNEFYAQHKTQWKFLISS
jgi:hypothetical protein